MNGAFHIAGIGLDTQQSALDLLANNIANINTRGFKRTDIQFSELVSQSRSASVQPNASQNATFGGVALLSHLAFNEQGELERTDNPLDLAIMGQGFLEVLGENGQRQLWRGGRLQVNAEGFLAASNGMMLASQINVPDAAVDVQINSQGLVSVRMDTDDIEEIGSLEMLRVRSMDGLTRMDDGFYRIDNAAGIENAQAEEAGMGRFVQGSVERSNVDLNREMVDMMIVQRAYSANAQIVQAADQMASIANSLRR